MVTEQQLKDFKDAVSEAIREALVEAAPYDTGRLQGSIKIKFEGDDIIIEMVDYALYVEFGCFFDSNTLIRTKNGLIKISELNIDDLVWTGNKWKKIIQKEKIDIGYPINKIIIEVNNNKLELTEDHPVKTKNGWKKAKDLTLTDEVYLYE